MSAENQSQLSLFLGTSVLPGTQRTYQNHWALWCQFIDTDGRGCDYYLRDVPEPERAAWIGLFIYRRYQLGIRGKVATSVTAGIRMRFAEKLQTTVFLNSSVIATARKACQLKPEELRLRRSAGINDSVKLPVSHDVLMTMRTRLWCVDGWEPSDMASRMKYIGSMWGFDQTARVSEYTKAEPGAQDHCVRVDDLTFFRSVGDCVVGSAVASLLSGETSEGAVSLEDFIECRVLPASSKGKVVVKAKSIQRRSPEESQFMDDVITFIAKSGASGDDELFSYRNKDGKKIVLRSRSVREELKEECKLHGLPPAFFSSHSYRKGAVTHMRAAGVSEDDRRDRSGHAAASEVMNATYDYATGMGPLAATSLLNACCPTVLDVKKLFPAKTRARVTRNMGVRAVVKERKGRAGKTGPRRLRGLDVLSVTMPSVSVGEGNRDPESALRTLRA